MSLKLQEIERHCSQLLVGQCQRQTYSTIRTIKHLNQLTANEDNELDVPCMIMNLFFGKQSI